MATYYRPNLTGDQRDALVAMTEQAIAATGGINDPAFDSLYRLLLKLRDCRPIGTERKEPNARPSH